MSAQETIFSILKEVRTAIDISSKGISVEGLIELSSIYSRLFELDANHDLLFCHLRIEMTGSDMFRKLCQLVIDECNGYVDLFETHKDEFENAGDFQNLCHLVSQKAYNEFSLKTHCAQQEYKKWHDIYNKYNDITRLYNSHNTYLGKDIMEIIDKYRDELYELVGHPIHLETINEEHDEAKRIMDQKWEDLGKLREQRQRRAEELLDLVNEGVLFDIYYYVSSLKDAFQKSEHPFNDKSTRRGPGRPAKGDDKVIELVSCFIDKNMFDKLRDCVNKEETPLTGNAISYLFDLLYKNKCFIPSLRSKEEFGHLMIKEFGEKVGIKNGHYVHSGNDHPEFKTKWESLLGL